MTDDYIEVMDQTLEEQMCKLRGMDPCSEEFAKGVKSIEVLSGVRTDVYRAQNEAYVASEKAQQDAEKLELDKQRAVTEKRQGRGWMILNALITAISAVGSIGVPLWIMSAERRGEFWSNRAMNASEKPPKMGLIRLPWRK